jgi:HEAT repeat protein
MKCSLPFCICTARKILSSADIVTFRPCAAIVLLGWLSGIAVPIQAAQTPSSRDVKLLAAQLGDLDHAIRTHAARLIRRAPAPEAVAALTAAVRESPDQYVRYRAMVLLTGFNDRGTPALVLTLLGDRNDRLREVAYRWLEHNPDPSLTSTLIGTLGTEQAEFVRPALINALAALSTDPVVQRALTTEAGRGLDFFRSSVIEALGATRARWAVATISDILKVDGPLQDDAAIALGRIGDPQALQTLAALPAKPPEVAMSALAARCLLGDNCATHLTALTQAANSRVSSRDTVRAAILGLSTVALASNDALSALAGLTSNEAVRDDAVLRLGGVGLKAPTRMLAWLEAEPASRHAAIVDDLREAFDRLEEDFAEERFFAATRAAYWNAPEGSSTRTLMATVIEKLGF